MELTGKQVLVTGADGFIGSHLTERLLGEGCVVRAMVFYNSFNSYGWLDTLPADTLANLDIVPGDIRDPHGVAQSMQDVDVVFHLAALISIPFSYHSPDSYVDTNIKGTLNILQAARRAKCQRVIVTSTSEVYGTAKYVPIDEQHSFQGQSPYSASKIGADRLAESFFRSFGLPLTIVRPFNTYGPRQSARAVIPTLITQMLDGCQEIRLGSLLPTRDFVFVNDTVEAFVSTAQADAAIGEEINVATQSEISIGDLATKLKTITASNARIVLDERRLRPDASEVMRLLGSNEKLRRLTSWTPRVSLDVGLEATVDWFRVNRATYKSGSYNI